MIKLSIAHTDFIKNLQGDGKSSATVTAYSKDIEQLTVFLEKEGVELVSQVETTHLEKFMKKLGEDQYTLKSISRKTNATKTFFKFLHKSGHISLNVADLLKHPKVSIKAPRILSKIEYKALRDAAKGDTRSYAMIEMLLQTGVTISELADMKIKDLNIKNETEGSLFIPNKNIKESRNIPLNKAIIEALNKYINEDRPKVESEHVFITKSGNSLLVRNIRSTIDRYFKLAGVEKAKVNDLRHTFVAYHLASGVNMMHLSKIAGHKRISTTERYLQYIEKTTTEEKMELSIL